jgi:hypothetical protein
MLNGPPLARMAPLQAAPIKVNVWLTMVLDRA